MSILFSDYSRLLGAAITNDSEIRLQDAKQTFTAVIDGGLIGVETVLNFIEKNFEKMRK